MLQTKKYGSRTKTRFVFNGLIVAVIFLILAGCSIPMVGRLQNSAEVTEIFKNNQILPNHQYYIGGSQIVPYAIMAIDNNYQLRPGHWKPIDMDSAVMNVLIYRMRSVYSINPRGAWILDHEGNRLGIWYSSRSQTRVKREKDNWIVVVSPDPPDLRGIP